MPQRPRGTRDFAPAEAAARHTLATTFRRVFERFGFREVQTPTFEELDLFTAKSGDGIISELYNFEDKGGRKMTLRPELTAPVMRMVFENHAFDPKPLKWFYFGNCFRYDRPQTGRYREFWQFGCEQVGAGTPLAYAELIALGDGLLDAAGLEGRTLSVGHVAVLKAAVDTFEFDAESRGAMMRAIDKGDKDAMAAVATAKGGCEAALDRLQLLMAAPDVAAARHAMADAGVDAELDELESILAHLQNFDVTPQLNLGIARGLDYYTGPVFEIHCDALEAQSQLLGGGGYDLSGIFDAKPLPTMGFGLGFDRTLVALEAEGNLPEAESRLDVYLGALGDEAAGVVARAATKMRSHGLRVDLDLMGRKPNQIAKAADAAGARQLLILGARDLESGECQVKNLSTGDQQTLALDHMVDWMLEQSGRAAFTDYN